MASHGGKCKRYQPITQKNADDVIYVIIGNPEVSTESSQNSVMSSYPQLAYPGNHPRS
jgi:hypothetical protein